MSPAPRRALLLAALFLAAWLPRVAALGAFVTPDEHEWLTHAANFWQAINRGDLAATYQREHPAVTMRWAGALGIATHFPTYTQVAPGPFAWEQDDLEQWLRGTPHTPLDLLVAGRWWITLWIALALTATEPLLRRLVGPRAALLAVLWMAWDPFHVALSRQLQPDGLLASLMLLALLAFLVWLLDGRQRRFLALSAAAMGLAWLTKTPAIFLVLYGALLAAGAWLVARQRGRHTHFPLWPLVAWGAGATLLFVALWPVMWVQPLATLREMAATMRYYAETGQGDGFFFLGRITREPGLLFYPVVYLFRTTPLTLLGLLLAALLRPWRHAPPAAAATALALLGYALLFGAFMSLGNKMHDRYLLPAFLPLDILAAWGFQMADTRWQKRLAARPTTRRPLPFAIFTLQFAIILHGLLAAAHFPYYLTYFNPLLGGLRGAERWLFVGWGEGLNEAAAWLNTQPAAREGRVMAWYAYGPFSYYFDGQARGVNDEWAPAVWCDTPFVVSYINQRQRHLPTETAHAYLAGLTPAHTVQIGGLDVARVYDLRGAPLPPFGPDGARRADFGGLIRLLGVRLDRREVSPGDRLALTLDLQALAPMARDLNVLVRLVGPDGEDLWRDEGWPWGAPTSQWPRCEVRPDGHQIAIPPDAPPGLYRLEASFYDPATLAALPVTEANSDQPTGEQARTLALVQVGPPPTIATTFVPAPRFGDVAALTGATLPTTATPGSELALTLRWASLGPTNRAYTRFVHLVGPDGALVAQQDAPPLGGFAPTDLWAAGQQITEEVALSLPADLPPGDYQVRVGLYTLDGGRLPVGSSDNVTVGTIRVQ